MKTSSRRRMWVLAALIGLLSGCLGSSQSFGDDFSDPASGWGAASHETYVRGYQQGRYLFQIDVPQWFVWATGGRTFQDVEVEAVNRTAGQSDNHYGLICRYTDPQFYYFAISSDGYYAVFRSDDDGELIPLTGSAMLRSSAIHIDGADNHLHAVCSGTDLSFYVNGDQVARIEDETLEKGDVGMAVGTVDSGGATVWFDDLEVVKP